MDEVKARILDAVAGHRDTLRRVTERLVRIPSENPPGACYRESAEALARELEALDLPASVHRVETPAEDPDLPPRYWVEGGCGEGERVLYFHGHHDVVPAASRDQFTPVLKKDILFGRGTSDMKGGLASMIVAMRVLLDCGVPLDGRVALVAVPDEETGGRWGSGWLAAQGLLGKNGIGALTAEPTGGVVWNASRGAVSLRVTVKGRPAHVGLHYRGVNAFEGMLRAAAACESLAREVVTRRTEYQIEPEEARRSILLLGGESGGSGNFNVVPGRCFFTVDRRFNPEEDLATERDRLLRALRAVEADGVDLDVDVLQEAPAAGVPEEGALARALSESIREVTGSAARFEMCPGVLETRFYTERGIAALAYGPGLLTVSHGPNEYVKLGDLETSAAVYALTARRMLGPSQ